MRMGDSVTTEELVFRFINVGVQQDKAELAGDIAKINRLFDEKTEILEQLKLKPGDGRRALLALYDHANMQVRLNAVKATLAVSPAAARTALEAIASSKVYPQAMDAGMSLDNLDRGVFKPT